jgi:peptidoglycan hydrolase CwlO-like protein
MPPPEITRTPGGMTLSAAVLGLAGVILATLLTLVGVLISSRAPSKLAEVQGMQVLLDEMRHDRDDWRTQATTIKADLSREIARLQAEIARLQSTVAELRAELSRFRGGGT